MRRVGRERNGGRCQGRPAAATVAGGVEGAARAWLAGGGGSGWEELEGGLVNYLEAERIRMGEGR